MLLSGKAKRMLSLGKILGSRFHNLRVSSGMRLNEVERKAIEPFIELESAAIEKGFPSSICVSVSEVICHGIPDSRMISRDELLKVDLAFKCNGVYSDTC